MHENDEGNGGKNVQLTGKKRVPLGLVTDVETSSGEMVVGMPKAAARRRTVGRHHPEQANEAERRHSSDRGRGERRL
jgi:hypothetical protein